MVAYPLNTTEAPKGHDDGLLYPLKPGTLVRLKLAQEVIGLVLLHDTHGMSVLWLDEGWIGHPGGSIDHFRRIFDVIN